MDSFTHTSANRALSEVQSKYKLNFQFVPRLIYIFLWKFSLNLGLVFIFWDICMQDLIIQSRKREFEFMVCFWIP